MKHASADSTITLYATGELRICSSPVHAEARQRASLLDQKRKVPDSIAIRAGSTVGCATGGKGAIPRPTRFTPRARRTLREAGVIFDEYFPRTTGFFTLTLPADGDEAKQALARYSAVIVARIKQWLRDVANIQATAWVWEWQKRGALHLHIVAASEKQEDMAEAILQWRGYCGAMLERLSIQTGVDFFWNAVRKRWNIDWRTWQFDATLVGKSAARYISKYISKNVASEWKEGWYHPSRWWAVSKFVLARIYRRRQRARIAWKDDAKRQAGHLAIVAALQKAGANILQYANKRYWWLSNYLARFEDDTCMWTMMSELLRRCKETLSADYWRFLWAPYRAPQAVAEPEDQRVVTDAWAALAEVGLRPLRTTN